MNLLMPNQSNLWLYDVDQSESLLDGFRGASWASELQAEITQSITHPLKRKMAIFSALMSRKLLAEYLNTSADTIELSKNEHGKPNLIGSNMPKFNISHTGNIWAMALDADAEIGLDIEQFRTRKYMDRIISENFHANEASHFQQLNIQQKKEAFFYKLWTQKEAYAKYLGIGLSYDFACADFHTTTPSQVTFFSTRLERIENHQSIALTMVCKKTTPLKKHQFHSLPSSLSITC